MKTTHLNADDLKWLCISCGKNLVAGPVSVSYMGNRFTTELPHCPGCGWVLVTEEVAMGKMAEVEGILEDK
jgi:predicted RNA-binding Zn-ribbon protein involved in translation (DUF1610 family)